MILSTILSFIISNNFISIGDWGKINKYQGMVSNVAYNYGYNHSTRFMVALGDNFYEEGIKNISDPLWDTIYKNNDMYKLPIKWNVILGNHDYYGNVSAEIDYSHYDPKWNLPSKYYSINFNNNTKIVLIDTQILDTECTVTNNHITSQRIKDDFYKWFDQELRTPESMKIIIGHASIYSVGGIHPECKELRDKMLPILKRHNIKIYIHGHDHLFQHNVYDGINFIGCGSAAKVVPKSSLKINKKYTKFFKIDYGFCAHYIHNNRFDTIMINKNNNIIYKISIDFGDKILLLVLYIFMWLIMLALCYTRYNQRRVILIPM